MLYYNPACITLKICRRLGGMNSGMPSAPGRLLFTEARPLVAHESLPDDYRITMKAVNLLLCKYIGMIGDGK